MAALAQEEDTRAAVAATATTHVEATKEVVDIKAAAATRAVVATKAVVDTTTSSSSIHKAAAEAMAISRMAVQVSAHRTSNEFA